MKELTRAEDEIMQVLWDLKNGFVKEVIDKLPEPKPAYNTVSTILFPPLSVFWNRKAL